MADDLSFLIKFVMSWTWAGKVALVTGASEGIGKAIARHLVVRGVRVVGCARRVELIQALSEELKSETGSLTAIRCDLSQEDDILKMFEGIKKQFGGVDICVNNAGLSRPATLLEGDTAAWRAMLDVNILGLTICTKETVKSLRERNSDHGHIINISSLSGYRIPPGVIGHFYSTTKMMVKGLCEATRTELRNLNSNIRISCVSPGLVETGFAAAATPDDPERVKNLYGRFKCLQPEDIADIVMYILSAPLHVEINDVLVRPTLQKF